MHFAQTPIALAAITPAADHLPSLAQTVATEAPGLPAITVTSTSTERRVDEVPNTVSVKSARAVEQAGARDIKDVYRDELDVTLRQQANRYNQSGGAASAGNEGINIRGLEGNQVLMLVDGISVPARFTFGPIGTSRGDFLNTGADALIAYAGARNAFADVEGYKTLSLEVAVAAAPDVIGTTDSGLATVGGTANLMRSPDFSQTGSSPSAGTNATRCWHWTPACSSN